MSRTATLSQILNSDEMFALMATMRSCTILSPVIVISRSNNWLLVIATYSWRDIRCATRQSIRGVTDSLQVVSRSTHLVIALHQHHGRELEPVFPLDNADKVVRQPVLWQLFNAETNVEATLRIVLQL